VTEKRRKSRFITASEDEVFVKAIKRALMFVPKDLEFSCVGCMDRGFQRLDVMVNGVVYWIPFACSDQVHHRYNQRVQCPASEKVLYIITEAQPEEGRGLAGKEAYGKAKIPEPEEGEQQPQQVGRQINVRIKDVLPSRQRATEIAASYVKHSKDSRTRSVPVRRETSDESTRILLDSLSVSIKGMNDQQDMVTLGRLLESVLADDDKETDGDDG